MLDLKDTHNAFWYRSVKLDVNRLLFIYRKTHTGHLLNQTEVTKLRNLRRDRFKRCVIVVVSSQRKW